MRRHADIYILGVGSAGKDSGCVLSQRVAGTLERGGFSCTGEHDASGRDSVRLTIEETECRCVFLVLAAGVPVYPTVVHQLRSIGGTGKTLRCIYEAGPSACQDLSEWGSATPTTFLRPAVPVSRHFPRVSERLVLAAAAEELARAIPRQAESDGQAVTPRGFPADPGSRLGARLGREFQSLMAADESADSADFSELGSLECVQWLAANGIFSLDSSTARAQHDLRCLLARAPVAYPSTSSARPVYVSFVPPTDFSADAVDATEVASEAFGAETVLTGLREVPTQWQLDCLKESLQSLPAGRGGLTVAFPVPAGYEGPGLPEVLLTSRIAVLEDGRRCSDGSLLHLAYGPGFVEAALAVVTGRLAPCRPGQLQELDHAIGQELEPAASLNELVATDEEGSGNFINRLCALVQCKAFPSGDARAWWIRHLRRALENHPLLQGRAYRRTLLAKCVSTESLSINSFPLAAGDLINNECANALADLPNFRVRVVSEAPTEMHAGSAADASDIDVVDWSDQVNQQRLKDLRKLTFCLFHAFDKDALQHRQDGVNMKAVEGCVGRPQARSLRALRDVVRSDAFSLTFAFLTIYTLFAPNVMLAFGISTQQTPPVAIVNSIVLGFFLLEAIVSCFFVNGYVRSGRVLLDIMAMVSLIGDTSLHANHVPSEYTSSRTASILETVRFSSRSSRSMLSIWKFARLARIVQLLRTFHGIVWRNYLRPHHGLAQQLYHKRLWRVFQDLDEERKGCLSSEEMDFFFTGMRLAFPEKKVATSKSRLSIWSSGRSWFRTTTQGTTCSSRKNTVRSRLSHLASSANLWECDRRVNCDGSFASIVRELSARTDGKRALEKCQEDVQRVKASCSLVQKVSGPVVVKVCLIVLAVMAVVGVLESSFEDRGDLQGLLQLGSLAAQQPRDLCAAVDDYAEASLHRLLLVGLAVGGAPEPVPLLWSPEACQFADAAHVNKSVNWLDVADEVMSNSGLQAHELLLLCIPKADCTGTPTSLALFDIHTAIRGQAEADIVYTLVVVVLMVVFALLFMHALNRVNTRMLHPLWSILDDMASLRSLEVVRMANFQPATQMLKELQRGSRNKDRRGWRRALGVCKRGLTWLSEHHEKLEDAVELTDLRRSLSSMRSALRSWAKYVPPYLLKSLYRRGIEATWGVTTNEVSVFFCDVDGFRDMCRDMSPTDVLSLLGLVHGEVSNAIEGLGGTLLEFVGDEVLAVFNAPNELIDHAQRALGAAADVLERAQRLGVRLRIGVHSGKVLVGNIGSPTRIKYGVLGDGVNVAARLKSLNSHYSTCCLVSDECLDDADDMHTTYLSRPVGKLILKGRKSPTTVWEMPALRSAAPSSLAKAFDAHTRAFTLFLSRRFGEARPLFAEVSESLSGRSSSSRGSNIDVPSQHLLGLCDKYLKEPPPADWDGSEVMSKK